ncbi:MAG: aminotransferase class III-fold pyridoxal phosphate-dependent enzyme, partial [Pseudomonadota bacterium]
GDLDVAFFCNSGAEANEGALKLASKYAGPKRDMIAYTDISFHGKTMATLSVSGSEQPNSSSFKTLEGCVCVPYGDAAALERLFAEHTDAMGFGKCRISTFIVEAIRSEGVVVPPKGYLARVRALCTKYDVVLICDEVFCGFGRTGKLFAFEHDGVVPDIVTMSKAFGAGKATFAAFVTRPKFFNRAYGSVKEATLHSTTFNGYGEELVAAITGMHVLYDEDLIGNSERVGAYLLTGLRKLKEKYPRLISEVGGIGLLTCLRTENAMAKSMSMLAPNAERGRETFAKITTAGIISELYTKHDILTYTPLHDSGQILITPPLIVSVEEIDRFITALDDVLASNVLEHGMRLAKRAFGLI